MSYRLRMSDEIRAWLIDLRGTKPETAGLVGEALTALIEEGANLGPPLVGPLAGDLTPDELIEALNDAYELKLEQVRSERREVAEAAAAEIDLPPFEQTAIAALQADADAFRIRKEVLKARCVAAELMLEIDRADAAAAAQLGDVTAQMRRELAGGDELADALMELRPGAPDDGGVLVFFAVEPPGVALLVSVLEGSDAIDQQRGQAMVISAEVLHEVRAGRDPAASEWEYADAQAFLDEFFADSADEMRPNT